MFRLGQSHGLQRDTKERFFFCVRLPSGESERHATLLSCAESVNVQTNGAEEKGVIGMCSLVSKVDKAYQEIRTICREHPECNTLEEAQIRMNLDKCKLLCLTEKGKKILACRCKWLGL